MESVERIPKNGHNTFHNYRYATEADVSDHCRKLMAEHHILMTIDVETIEQLDDICRMRIRYTFHDGDSEAIISFALVSDGQDKQDKGPYKAITGGVKYALMKTFLIPTGDDPEKDTEKDTESRQTKYTPNPAKSATDANPDADAATRKKLGDMIIQMARGDTETAKTMLEGFTHFVDGEKKTHELNDLTKLKGKWLASTYGKVKDEYAEWEKVNATIEKQESVQPEPGYDDSEIPFGKESQ